MSVREAKRTSFRPEKAVAHGDRAWAFGEPAISLAKISYNFNLLPGKPQAGRNARVRESPAVAPGTKQ